jgi:carotenoid 1,2-hydratase
MNLLSGIEQDFHRPQKNPGAYEWWHFDGTDDNSGVSFSAQYYAGHPLSPFYQEKLATYWKESKSPLVANTKVDVPNPLDFCGVIFRVFRKGRLIGEFLQEFEPGMLKASDHQPAVLLGSNRFNWDPAGNPPSYNLTLQGPLQTGGQSLRARLFFTPEKISLPAQQSTDTFPTHTWILAAPRCHVEGTIEWCDSDGNIKKEQVFVGQGYHDHHFGTVPLDRFLKAWHWGRAYLGNQTLVYSVQVPIDEKEPIDGLLLTANQDEAHVWKVAFQLSKRRRNFFWLPYHKILEFTDADSLRVTHLKILGDGPASLVFEDKVLWDEGGKILTGSGMSNYLYTPRLSGRFFYPLLKGKTFRMTKSKNDLPGALNKPGGDVFTDRPAL